MTRSIESNFVYLYNIQTNVIKSVILTKAFSVYMKSVKFLENLLFNFILIDQ